MAAEPVFIATQDIFVGYGVAAHRKGDVVPAENVKANGWGDFVARAGTKAAESDAPVAPVAPEAPGA